MDRLKFLKKKRKQYEREQGFYAFKNNNKLVDTYDTKLAKIDKSILKLKTGNKNKS
jgi:hypothetical protein